jgi:hypothetical protein
LRVGEVMVLREGGNRLGATALAEPEYGDCHLARPGRRLIGVSRPNAGYSTLGWYDNANGDVAVSITGSGVWRWEELAPRPRPPGNEHPLPEKLGKIAGGVKGWGRLS